MSSIPTEEVKILHAACGQKNRKNIKINTHLHNKVYHCPLKIFLPFFNSIPLYEYPTFYLSVPPIGRHLDFFNC